MKNITVAIDDDTYRFARIKAAERGTSVSAMVREYLAGLAEPQTGRETLREIIESIRAEGGGINPADNLTREELHQRREVR